jgi:hypothetical protein
MADLSEGVAGNATAYSLRRRVTRQPDNESWPYEFRASMFIKPINCNLGRRNLQACSFLQRHSDDPSRASSSDLAVAPDLHLSLSADLTWADSNYQRTFFGVTPAQAARATADGNALRAYAPRSGLSTVGLAGAGVYQLGGHWALVARVGLHDLIGPSGRDSPLTQRTFQPNFALGGLYKF